MISQHHREFEKTIRQLANRYHLWEVYSDFVNMAAISLYNSIHKDQEQEDRYLQIAGRYSKDELSGICKMLALTVNALEGLECDFLGEMFMTLELANKWKGQFFTPFSLCQMMAAQQIDGTVESIIHQRGFATVSDPAVGGGAMVIGMARAMIDKKINYQQCLHATVVDIDQLSFCMCYIQLTLLNIPAVVVNGNSLTLECSKAWNTPAHVLGLWDYRLKEKTAELELAKNLSDVAPVNPVEAINDVNYQMELIV